MARTIIEGTEVVAIDASPPADPAATSWGAIVAGAVAATALSLVLMLLGSGLGLTVVSPWSFAGASATTFAVSTAIWLIVTQWVSAGLGGYVAGRLRSRWTSVTADEVFFRDTAHGFVAWALSILIVASVLGSAAAVTGTALRAAAVGGTTATAYRVEADRPMGPDRTAMDEMAYLVDRLLRVPAPPGIGAPTTAAEARAETQRILATGLDGQIADGDRTYLVTLVANRAGISADEAQLRVAATIAHMEAAKLEAQKTAESARKVAATTAIVGALALLIGAFIAGVAAAIGGRLRDDPTR